MINQLKISAQTGVINGNKVNWDNFADYIDKYYMYQRKDKINEIKRLFEIDKFPHKCVDMIPAIESLVDTYMESTLSCDPSSAEIQLYGDWKLDESGEYIPDEELNNDNFAAIYDSNYNIFQIIWSKYVIENRGKCSPCYPNQLDLESDNGYGIAYSFPLDNYSTDFINEISNNYYDFSK